MTLSVAPVDPRSVALSSGLAIDMPVNAYAAVDTDGQIHALWGLAWGGGRCWIWFHVERSDPRYATLVIRQARKILRRAVQLGETEVYTPRDRSYERSEKLLTMLDFTYFAEEAGEEVWIWRHSR